MVCSPNQNVLCGDMDCLICVIRSFVIKPNSFYYSFENNNPNLTPYNIKHGSNTIIKLICHINDCNNIYSQKVKRLPLLKLDNGCPCCNQKKNVTMKIVIYVLKKHLHLMKKYYVGQKKIN